MSPELWQQIEAIFQTAVDLKTADRAAFIKKACAGDDELRSEVEKLMADYDSAANFIESPVWTDSNFLNSSAKKIISDSIDESSAELDRDDLTGRQIGSYRLVNEIGRGGMGAVFLAERADGEFSQNVAIKLIKRGMDSDFIIRRFRHEPVVMRIELRRMTRSSRMLSISSQESALQSRAPSISVRWFAVRS